MTASVRGLRIGVSELRRHPGERMRVDRAIDLDGIEVSTAAVPAGASGHLDVVLESLSDGITVTGTLRVPWTGPCRRCLEETTGIAEVRLREVYADRPTDDDLLPLDGDSVDLGPLVHDTAVLALPLAPLCTEDCVGPAPDTFPVRTAEDVQERTDPRWAALDALRFDQGSDDRLE